MVADSDRPQLGWVLAEVGSCSGPVLPQPGPFLGHMLVPSLPFHVPQPRIIFVVRRAEVRRERWAGGWEVQVVQHPLGSG